MTGVFLVAFSGVGFASSPAPYSLPWQMRPAAPVSVVRLDSLVSLNNNSTTFSYFVAGSYKAWKNLAPFVRIGVIDDTLLSNHVETTAVTNPALGAAYTFMLPKNFRLTSMLASTIPVGMGGGNSPDLAIQRTIRSGIFARAAMDNAMFAVNDWTIIPGIDAAWVAHKLTVQVEATFLFLTRVRGEKIQKDTFKVNFTSGLHVGYFVMPWMSLSAELHYQRWLSTPVAVAADSMQRDTLSVAGGVRFHFQLTDRIWLRPGLAYGRGLTGVMAKQNYNLVFFDLPIAF